MATDSARLLDGRWAAATREFRATIRWCAGAIGAAAASVLGSASVLSLAKPDDNPGLGTSLLLGVSLFAVLAGCCLIIYRLLDLLAPTEMTSSQLPASLTARISADPRSYLVGDATNVSDFLERKRAYARAAATLRQHRDLTKNPTLQQMLAVQQSNAELYYEHEVELLAMGAYVILREKFGSYPYWLFLGLLLVVGGIVGLANV